MNLIINIEDVDDVLVFCDGSASLASGSCGR